MTVVFDGRVMLDKATTHARIKEGLALSELYGNNLDALFDVLSTTDLPRSITWVNLKALKENLGPYAVHLLDVFVLCAKNNPAIEVTFEE